MIRPFKIEDVASIVENANNEEVCRYMLDGFPFPFTEENGFNYVSNAMHYDPPYHMAIDVNGMAVGYVGIIIQPDIMCMNAEIGFWLGRDYWGKGIATQAVKEMVRYSFDNFNLTRIYAKCIDVNWASRMVLSNSGFSQENLIINNLYKNGTTLSEVIFGIRKHMIEYLNAYK